MLRPLVFKRRGDDRFELRLGTAYREVLARLADELLDSIDQAPDDASLEPLWPTVHPDDIASEAEWQMTMGAALGETRRGQLTFLRDCAERKELTEDEVIRWMQAVNAIRLVLGSRLGLDEDAELVVADDDPRAPMVAAYEFLSDILQRTVDALSD